MIASGFFNTYILGKLRPPAQILQFNIDGMESSGIKHVESGVYKPYAKTGLCGGFEAQHASGVSLDFGETIPSTNGFYSKTICFTFNQGEVNSHPDSYFATASGIGQDFKVFNVKCWSSNLSAFGTNRPTWYYLPSKAWRRSFSLSSGTAGVQILPSVMPTLYNIPTLSPNAVFISGCYRDSEFSRFVYIVGLFPSGQYELGTYGGQSVGDFKFRLSYDWTGIKANVLDTDI